MEQNDSAFILELFCDNKIIYLSIWCLHKQTVLLNLKTTTFLKAGFVKTQENPNHPFGNCHQDFLKGSETTPVFKILPNLKYHIFETSILFLDFPYYF